MSAPCVCGHPSTDHPGAPRACRGNSNTCPCTQYWPDEDRSLDDGSGADSHEDELIDPRKVDDSCDGVTYRPRIG